MGDKGEEKSNSLRRNSNDHGGKDRKSREGTLSGRKSGDHEKGSLRGGEFVGTPADFVFQTMLGEFKEQAKRKIEEMMELGFDKALVLSKFFDLTENQTFGQLLEAMGKLSENAVPVLIRALLYWKSNQHVVESTLKSLTVQSSALKISQKDAMALLDERFHLAIDYIFCTTILSLLKSSPYSVTNLDEAICSKLEEIAFEHFKPTEKQVKALDAEFAEALAENRQAIPKLYAKILGILSPTRLTHIAAVLFKEVGVLGSNKSSSVTKTKMATIEGMRYLQLHIDTKAGVEQALGFLARYFDMFKHKSSDLKLILSQTIVSICQPLLQQPLAKDVDYTEWHKAASSRYQQYYKKIKSRSVKIWYPFLTILLCLGDKEFFNLNVWNFNEALLKLLKDRTQRATALECIYHTVGTYLGKYNDSDVKKLQAITSHVFSSGTWKTPHDAAQLGIYVDIIAAIAEKKLDYAMKTIIFDLLRVETAIQPERVIIGVKALLRVLAKERSKTNDPPEAIPASIAPYMTNINDFYSTILGTLDKNYGHLVLPHTTKQNQELLQKESLGIKLLRVVLSCIPTCLPTKLTTAKFMEILARHAIHLDSDIREHAEKALTLLMCQCPNLRPDIVYAAAQLPMTLPDTSPKLMHNAIKRLSTLLHTWSSENKNEDDHRAGISHKASISREGSGISKQIVEAGSQFRSEMKSEMDFNPSAIEAVCLVILCSPHAALRQMSVEVMIAVRLIATSLLEQKRVSSGLRVSGSGEIDIMSEADVPPARVMDVFDETGPDAVQRFNQDLRYRLLVPLRALPGGMKSLDVLWAQETQESQLAWTYCLGGLLPLTLNICPDAVNAAWKLVYARARVINIKTEEKSPAAGPMDTLWSNYIMFICATLTDAALEPGSKKQPNSIVDIFKEFTTLFKAERQITSAFVVMALQRTNPAVYNELFDSLRPVEQEYTFKKKKKGTDELRTQISFIYGHIAENMQPGTLVDNENLRQIFLGWILETTKYLTHTGTESVLDNQGRYALLLNFCDIISSVAKELHAVSGDSLFEASSRKTLFQFLMHWCRGERLLDEEADKRAYQSTMGRIGDAAKKAEYDKSVRERAAMLQHYACSAAASLLLGPVFDDEALKADGPIFTWINGLLAQKERKKLTAVGRTALENFLQNTQHTELLATTINQCYSNQTSIARGYFQALVEIYKMQTVTYSLHVIFTLILLKAGDPVPVMRKNAIQLLQLIAPQTVEENLNYSPLSVSSTLDVTYRRCQYELSQRLAKQNPNMVAKMIAETVHRLENCNGSEQKQLLTTIIPWIQEMNNNLYKGDEASDFLSDSEVDDVLQNFLVITYNYADAHPIHISKIWTTLAAEDESIDTVINFLLNFGVKKRSQLFIPLAKKVITFFGRAQSQVTVDTLVHELAAVSDAAPKKEDRSTKQLLSGATVRGGSLNSMGATLSGLGALMPDTNNYSPPARGHLALIFLAELAFEVKEEFLPHLPVILHQVFLGLDSFNALVYEHSRVLLLNLIHSLVVERLQSQAEVPESFTEYEEALDLEEHFLKVHEGKPLWQYEDISIRKTELQSTKELDNLVKRVINIFVQEETLRDDWGTESLKWAVSCPSAHLATRSYQVYRALLPCAARDITPVYMLDRMFARCLSRNTDNLAVSLEILLTLQAIVDTMDSAKLYPQIFWAAVALLQTDYEQEYIQAIKLLSKLITRFNFADVAIQNVFFSVTPKGWEPPFEGLQPLVMRGLLSPNTFDACIDLISKMTLLPCSQIFYPEPKRLLANILAMLPWIAHHIVVAEEDNANRCYTAAANLTEASTAYPKLAKIFQNCKKKHYTSMEALFGDLYKPFAATFFPEHISYTFRFLFSLLENGPIQHQRAILLLIKYLLNEVNLGTLKKQKAISSWLSCIARFVVSPNSVLYKDALDVLALVVKQSELSVSHISSFRPLQLSSPFKQFPNQASQGDEHTLKALRDVLKSSEQREKGNLISDAFWNSFFYTDEDAAESSEGTNETRSPRATFVTAHDEIESEDESGNVDFSEFQDIFSAFSGPTSYATRPEMSELDRTDHSDLTMGTLTPRSYGADTNGSVLISGRHDKGDKSPRGKNEKEEAMLSSGDGDDFMDADSASGNGGAADSLASNRHKWRKLSEKRTFKTEAEMFEIFPVAGQLAKGLLADYRNCFPAWNALIPASTMKTLVSNNALKAEVLDQGIFQQQIPEPKKVLFSIACSKYRSLAEDAKFLRAFTEKRIHVVDSFNRQQRIYFEQKELVDQLCAKLPKDEREGTAYAHFCEEILSLHHHLLLLFQINASLQALVNGVLDSSSQHPVDKVLNMDAEEEKQRTLIEKELEKNRQLVASLHEALGKKKKVSRLSGTKF